MKKIQLFALGAAWLIISCGEPTKEAKPETAGPASSATEECYAFTGDGDTVNLQMAISGQDVTGALIHNLDEKDRNKGTISGKLKGDTILADYRFSSEGAESVREIVFLKKDGMLYEGYGEMEDKNGKLQFIKNTNLQFTNGMVLGKVVCEK
jgi:hypothetical protein